MSELLRYRNLVKHLVHKDIKLKYRDSAVGLLWSLANPLLMLFVYTLAFKVIMRSDIENFGYFLLIGLLPWTFFSQSLIVASTSVLDNSSLVKKVRFPLESLPLAAVAFAFVQFLVMMGSFIPVGMFLHGVKVNVSILFLPVLLALQVALTVGLAFILAAGTVFYRDIRHLVEVLVMVLFWLTPVIYDLRIVPEAVRPWLYFNPMVVFVSGYHDILYHGFRPPTATFLAAAGYAGAAVLLGGWVFYSLKDRFAEVA